MLRLADAAMILGRLLLAALFIAGFFQKWLSPDDARSLLDDSGWPLWFFYPAMVLNGIAAACLLTGLWLPPIALAMALYCMLTSYFHFIPDDGWQMSIFIKNWAIAGGFLVLFSHETRSRAIQIQ